MALHWASRLAFGYPSISCAAPTLDYRGRQEPQMDLTKQTEAAMKILTELFATAKNAGDGDLMTAAYRAWTILHNHQTISLKEAVVKQSRS